MDLSGGVFAISAEVESGTHLEVAGEAHAPGSEGIKEEFRKSVVGLKKCGDLMEAGERIDHRVKFEV